MIYDLLSVDDKHRVEHIYTDNAGKEQTKKVVMNDEVSFLFFSLLFLSSLLTAITERSTLGEASTHAHCRHQQMGLSLSFSPSFP